MTKTKRLQIRANDIMFKRLEIAAKVIDCPAAQIVRQAVNQKLNELAVQYPEIDAPRTEQVETVMVA